MSALIEKLIAILGKCPCCQWGRTETNGPEDGIPDDMVHEAVFRCGAAAFVTKEGRLRVSRACPGPLEEELEELEDRVSEEMRAEAGGDR